jgi:uncharacterized tellurite resistance protein B-like protein
MSASTCVYCGLPIEPDELDRDNDERMPHHAYENLCFAALKAALKNSEAERERFRALLSALTDADMRFNDALAKRIAAAAKGRRRAEFRAATEACIETKGPKERALLAAMAALEDER